MANTLGKKMEEMGMAFIFAIVLVGSVGFSFWSTLNMTQRPVYNSVTGALIGHTATLDPTQLLAWGLVLTFICLSLGFGFMSYMRLGKKR